MTVRTAEWMSPTLVAAFTSRLPDSTRLARLNRYLKCE
jgi:hypothetical protein